MGPAPEGRSSTTPATERGTALALLPIAATLDYYALPPSIQEQTLVQLAPQILAYLASGVWAAHNRAILTRLGLNPAGLRAGIRWGIVTGLSLGCLNTAVILAAYPALGYDIAFLKQTPHSRLPVLVMVPWFVCGIALFVELNFRGFLLGRLASLESGWWKSETVRRLSPLALFASSLTFSFDPFMVATFRHLHWIGVWDGLIWGLIWLRTRNLYATIVAHAVEVIVMYLAVRAALS